MMALAMERRILLSQWLFGAVVVVAAVDGGLQVGGGGRAVWG
jgi:hypothetical protein